MVVERQVLEPKLTCICFAERLRCSVVQIVSGWWYKGISRATNQRQRAQWQPVTLTVTSFAKRVRAEFEEQIR